MAIRRRSISGNRKASRGFTLVEVIISIVVMTVGIVGLLAAFAASLATLQQSREDSIARQEAQQFIEGVYAARNSGAISFSNLQNQSQDPVNGFFKDGMQPANQAGPDGLMNTNDDLASLEVGPDGQPLTLQRQIVFNPFFLSDGVTVNPNLRGITITIQYGAGSMRRTYKEVTYISSYR